MYLNTLNFSHKYHRHTQSPNLCLEAVVVCVGKSRISIQCSCFTTPLNGYESAL